jgi:spore coat polysaccharide biosynthesis protein SpsF
MKTVVIVQARTGSTRLPGKVLKNLCGQTVLGHVVNRVHRCVEIDEIVVATTVQAEDVAIASEADRLGVAYFRGSETDVLSRYCLAARMADADLIVRITSDCPLVDPHVLDQHVAQFKDAVQAGRPIDYLSNTHPRSFPHGLDVEVFHMAGLETANQEATESYEREHVTPFFYLRPERFVIENIVQPTDQSQLRWTLDEADDWAFFEAVFAKLPAGEFPSTDRVLALLDRYPELTGINAGVLQKALKAA